MDPRGEAGRAAEKQMAFYLDEFFRRVPAVKIFHNVSFLGDAGIRHQIDHLVLHPRTLCIVESKSVSTEVVVNERGEWSRRSHSRLEGMPSPVEQAERQATALRRLLNDRSTELSAAAKPNKFVKTPIATFVAISDNGRWTQEGAKPTCGLPVFKADLISKMVHAEIERHEKASKLLARLDGDYGTFHLRDETVERFADLFRELSSPVTASPLTSDEPAPSRATEEATSRVTEEADCSFTVSDCTNGAERETYQCKSCKGSIAVAAMGLYGSGFFTCSACGIKKGTPRLCRSCRSQTRTTISGNSLLTQCKSCDWTLVTSADNPPE